MSASQWDFRLSASAESLLTEEQCFLLLDSDFLNTADDLLKNFPSAAPKVECGAYSSPALEDVSTMYPPSPPELKPSRAELAHDLLQQLDNQCKQENMFPNWLEEKVDLPMFESIPGVVERAVEPSAPAAVPVGGYLPPHTADLLREFEHVYDAVELTHLTPPHSPPSAPAAPPAPPGPATQLLLSYAHHAQAPPAPADPWPQYEELASVEELVRARAEQLVSASTSTSPRSSPPSSPRSSSTEDEWSAPPRARARPAPYARAPDDRRSRKKEQNKNAATRYRQKKKAEIEVLLSEEHALRSRHADLGDQCSDLQREIRYLKGLMRDLFKAKGLIK